MITNLSNWAGNLKFGASRFYEPSTLEDLQNIVRGSKNVKAVGSRHSFNRIADTDHDLISMKNFDKVLGINKAEGRVTVEGGITYGQLAPILEADGLALPNLASLPHISVAGACATATHGSGVNNGNLATSVSGIEFICPNGDLRNFSQFISPNELSGGVVHLGGLGIVSQITLNVIPTFEVKQSVFERLPLEVTLNHFDEIVSSAYSVSLFTDWREPFINQVWQKCIERDACWTNPEKHFFGGVAATRKMHPLADVSAENCTDQLGVPGPWFERLPHFRLDFTPSNGNELQSEYLVPYEQAVDSIRALSKISSKFAHLLMITEIRTIAADNFWMSPCYNQDCVGIHFTWLNEADKVAAILPTIEKALQPFCAKPHWGKLFETDPGELESSYSEINKYRILRYELDPNGKFLNPFLKRCFSIFD